MRCPYCGSLETQVKDSRPTDDASSIRRRRVCPDCGGRFTTFERVQLRELTVLKKSGRRDAVRPRQAAALARDRPCASVPVEAARVSSAWSTASFASSRAKSDGDITTDHIGELVMEGLRALDGVAYVRFASVYTVISGKPAISTR